METQTEQEQKICEDCKKEFVGSYGTLKSWKGILCPICYNKRFMEITEQEKAKKNMLNAMNKIAREVLKE